MRAGLLLFVLGFVYVGNSAFSIKPEDVRFSEWDAFYEDEDQTFHIVNKLILTKDAGKYVTVSNGTGTLSNVAYAEASGEVTITGKWALNGLSGTFKLVVNQAGDKFKGTWSGGGDAGVWNGERVLGSPDSAFTELPTPKLGVKTKEDFIHRHAVMTAKAIKVLAGGDCTVDLLGHGQDFTSGTSYKLYVRTKKGSDFKDINTFPDSNLTPRTAAVAVKSVLVDEGSPCLFLTSAQIQQRENTNAENAIRAPKRQFEEMKTLLDSPEGPQYRGRLNAPSILVSQDELIVVDPMDLKLQKKLLQQSDLGVSEETSTDGATTVTSREQVFGDESLLGIRLVSNLVRPSSSAESFSGLNIQAIFLGKTADVVNGYVQTIPNGELKEIRIKGELKALTPQGLKTLKSIDETKGTTYERPEEKFFDNVVLTKFPQVCTPTPIGLACIEGSIVGSVGIKPYGVKINPALLSDFISYVKPYARVSIDVFGGLEYGVAHAGVRGQVSIIDGTFALLAGNTNGKARTSCVRAEIDKAEMLNGRILVDLQVQGLPQEKVDQIKTEANTLCEKGKALGGQVVDIKKNLEQGAADFVDAMKKTRTQVADGVQKVGEAAKDIVDKGTKIISKPSVKVGGRKVPLVPFATSGPNFINSVENLAQTDCASVTDQIDAFSGFRYVKEIYHWDGVLLARHHKWYERCSDYGDH